MNTKFKVQLLQNGVYQIFAWEKDFTNITYDPPQGGINYETPVFQGTLPECEAWIKLKEGGYLE